MCSEDARIGVRSGHNGFSYGLLYARVRALVRLRPRPLPGTSEAHQRALNRRIDGPELVERVTSVMARSTSYYRVGRYIRFNKSDVLKWLEGQQTDW